MTRVSDDAEEISSFFIDGIPYFLINVGNILATRHYYVYAESAAGVSVCVF